jgi:glycine/D-amino acid oxidase-like deaminating enzyme
MTDVVVVGAGVIGASVAFRLAEAGAAVTVLEAGRVGGGTSGRSFAWTNSNNKTPRAYHDLNVAGMRAHAALAEEFGELPWWHGGGNVEWCHDAAERAAQRAKVERLRAWGYTAEWIDARGLRELEPDVDVAAVGDAPVAFFPEEGWLDPVVYAHAMLRAARRRGATVRTGVRVVGVSVGGGRAAGVRLAGGEHVSADVVVDCAGRWADEVAALAGARLPLAPTAGLLVLTPPVAVGLRRVVHAPRCNVRPDGAGRLMLHADDVDASLRSEPAPAPGPGQAWPDAGAPEPGPDHPLARELLARARELLPGVGDARPEAVRVGVRPIPADGLSAVGALPGLDGLYVVVTHSGVTLAPLLGRLVAQELARGEPAALLEPFRPARLVGRP